MEIAGSSEKLVLIYQITVRLIPEIHELSSFFRWSTSGLGVGYQGHFTVGRKMSPHDLRHKHIVRCQKWVKIIENISCSLRRPLCSKLYHSMLQVLVPPYG
jgi:hypothetical protein